MQRITLDALQYDKNDRRGGRRSRILDDKDFHSLLYDQKVRTNSRQPDNLDGGKLYFQQHLDSGDASFNKLDFAILAGGYSHCYFE